MSLIQVDRIEDKLGQVGIDVNKVVTALADVDQNLAEEGAGILQFDKEKIYPSDTVGKELSDEIKRVDDHIGVGGSEQHPIATVGVPGFMPAMPSNDNKTYAFRNGQLVELAVGAGQLMDIEWFSGYRSAIPTERPGCVAIDGQIMQRAVHPDVWAKLAAGNLYPMTATDDAWLSVFGNKRQFSPGDGSTTFRMMDLNGVTTAGKAMFVRGGSADSFSLVEDTLQGFGFATRTTNATSSAESLNSPGNTGFAGNSLSTDPGVIYTNKVRNGTYNAIGNDGVNGEPRIGTETAPAHAKGVWIIRVANAVINMGAVDVTALASQQNAQGAKIDNIESQLPFNSTLQTIVGTQVDFAGIPNWANEITVIVKSLTPASNSMPVIQFGQGATITTSGYTTTDSRISSAVATLSNTDGVRLNNSNISVECNGMLTLKRVAGGSWCYTYQGTNGGNTSNLASGYITLANVNRIRLTTTIGTVAISGSYAVSYRK